MPVQRLREPISAAGLKSIATRLLKASTLCAISTVSSNGRAHVNTAYFGWTSAFDPIWLSAPEARHSRNIRRRPSIAIAVFNSTQKWGGSDRGLQLFGSARELRGRSAHDADRVYGKRFTLKLFDEREFGGATFVTATVGSSGRLAWERTERFVRGGEL